MIMLGIEMSSGRQKKHISLIVIVHLRKAIDEVYPQILLIGSAGPDVTSDKYERAWDFYHQRQDEENFVYAVDEHYYVKPEWLFEKNDFYDTYSRKIKVFSGNMQHIHSVA